MRVGLSVLLRFARSMPCSPDLRHRIHPNPSRRCRIDQKCSRRATIARMTDSTSAHSLITCEKLSLITTNPCLMSSRSRRRSSAYAIGPECQASPSSSMTRRSPTSRSTYPTREIRTCARYGIPSARSRSRAFVSNPDSADISTRLRYGPYFAGNCATTSRSSGRRMWPPRSAESNDTMTFSLGWQRKT